MDLHLNDFATVAEYNAFIEGDYLKPNVSYIEEIDGVKYQKDAPDPAKQYLTFEALEDVQFSIKYLTSSGNVQYSLDEGATWTTFAENTDTPTVTSGSTIMWKGTLSPTSDGIGTFTSTGRFNAKGNSMSLLFGDNFIGQTDLTGKDYAFRYLFDTSQIVSAKNLVLPATTLTKSCYRYMFRGCTSLTTAPELPATTLAEGCYSSMFNGCTSLTSAPDMSVTAITGTQTCYAMFQNCSNLNYIKMLATNISGNESLNNWVSGVAATGTFVKAAGVTLPTGVNGIPEGWTVIEE